MLIGVANLCRGGVSQLNDGGYSPRGDRRCYIHSPEGAYSINQNCQEETKQWSNDDLSRLNPGN